MRPAKSRMPGGNGTDESPASTNGRNRNIVKAVTASSSGWRRKAGIFMTEIGYAIRGVRLVRGRVRGGAVGGGGRDDRQVRFCLGRFKTPDLKQPRLARTCRLQARAARPPYLQ